MMETMYYFGILHRMKKSRVRKRGKYLLNLLELPAETKLIRKLRYITLHSSFLKRLELISIFMQPHTGSV